MFIFSFTDAERQYVMVKGKRVYFDFSYRFGPLVTDKEGTPLARQPMSDRHPFWEPFNAWLVEFKKTNPPRDEKPKPGPSDYLDRRGG